MEPVRVYLWEDRSAWSAEVVERVAAWVAAAPLGDGPLELSLDDGDTWKPLLAADLARALARKQGVVTVRGARGEVAFTRRPRRAGVMGRWPMGALGAVGVAAVVEAMVGLAGRLPGFTWGDGQADATAVVRWAQAEGLRPLPEPLAEFPGWLHLVRPEALAPWGITAERLLSAPAARAWTTAEGILVVQVLDDPSAVSTPAGEERLAAFVRHLTA
jgi:hypothetical protein